MADIAQCVARCIAETAGPVRIPDQPPSANLVQDLLSRAMLVVNGDPTLREWMSSVGLDDDDSLLAIGLVVAISRRDSIYEVMPST